MQLTGVQRLMNLPGEPTATTWMKHLSWARPMLTTKEEDATAKTPTSISKEHGL